MKYENVIRKHFVVTSKSGEELLCMCRWHSDTSQGHLYANARTGLYICFSCGAKGHLDKIGVEIPLATTEDMRDRIRLARKPRAVAKTYPESWLKQYDFDIDYWPSERGLPDHVISAFNLGFDPFTNRATIPLRDMHGRILGTTFRRLDGGKPKYLHPKGFPIGKHLYGAWAVSDETRKVALVEGQVDALRGWAHNIPALSMMGSRITTDQVKVLKALNIRHVVLMLDNDTAGIQGTLSVHEQFVGSGIRVSVGWYRSYWNVKDPDGLDRHRYRKMFHSSVPIREWATRMELGSAT